MAIVIDVNFKVLIVITSQNKYRRYKRLVVSRSPHEYELPGLKIPRVAGLSHRMPACVSDPALHICSFLKERPKQSVP
jgi:hypothetical protein